MDYYQILQVDKFSSTKEIKKHYYSLSKKYHPDKNNGISDEQFKSLSEAYSILSNPRKRYLYDMKLLFKDNLGADFINHFSDQELEILHEYYQKLTESTEFRFLKLLFNSLPTNLKTKINRKFKENTDSKNSTDAKHALLNISDIKYIYATDLDEDFEINLNRSLKDVYLSICKEIIVLTKHNCYTLFITHSDYSLKIHLTNDNFLTINIQTILPEKYSLNGHDLYYNHQINLYEYYFTDLFPIILPNDFKINLINSEEFNNSVKIPHLGLKGTHQRGDFYIYKNINLMIQDPYQYQGIIKEIFT